MRSIALGPRSIVDATAAIVLGCLLLLAGSARAQVPGNNDVYNLSGQQQSSSAFIDALAVSRAHNNVDICATIYGILTKQFTSSYSSVGAVIDARGMSGTSLACANSPWVGGSGYANVPSTILLPAGTITISSTWALPNSTRVLGEGSADPLQNGNGTTSQQTTIQACNPTASCFNGSAMIQLGNNCPTPSCMAVSIEDVTLNGGNQQYPPSAKTDRRRLSIL